MTEEEQQSLLARAEIIIGDYREMIPREVARWDSIEEETFSTGSGPNDTHYQYVCHFTLFSYNERKEIVETTVALREGDIVPIGNSKCSQWKIEEIYGPGGDGEAIVFEGFPSQCSPVLGLGASIVCHKDTSALWKYEESKQRRDAIKLSEAKWKRDPAKEPERMKYLKFDAVPYHLNCIEELQKAQELTKDSISCVYWALQHSIVAHEGSLNMIIPQIADFEKEHGEVKKD